MTELHLRPYRASDRAAVIKLWTDCNLVVAGANDPEADIDFCIGQPNADIIVGEQDGALVATSMVGHDGHRGWIYYLAVAPSLQKSGLGRRMVQASEDWLRAHGAPKSQLMIRETNVAVEAFYHRLGYRTIPRLVLQKVL